jgi:type IV secretion system protein VirB10
VLGVLSLAGIVYFTSGNPAERDRQPRPVEGAPGQIGAAFEPYRPPPSPATRAALPMPAPGPAPTTPLGPIASAVAPQSQGYRPTPLMAFGGPGGSGSGTDAGTGGGGAGGGHDAGAERRPDGLDGRLTAEDQPTAVATRLPDRNLFLTEGTPIPCIPDAPITSDVEGAFRCKLPAPVYSTSGAVPLLDTGTWIVGRVGSGLRRGQRRLFAVMTRVETPQGCLIRIRAPAADALGQAGLDGEIDTHFFQRFGAYIGMAFLDASLQAAVLAASNAAAASRGGISFYQFQGAGRAGGQALFGEDAAIPPTLYRNQAEPIVVRLTQDVDMRPCFRLRLREDGR